MHSIKVFGLSILAIAIIILMGIQQLPVNHDLGMFFVFVGGCTAIGLTLDLVNHVKERIRKNNLRKLQP
jgi:site-specific recombinase